ncbi:iron-sulfur cluster assembly scaffold protein [Acidisoma cellulosilytica]|uniref:Iron-sulfur cluster assembly scaffold protein n=1 Tax=Acidisoma cellulosilyticum TaxID=2802395 RepID=A0A963Z0W3_9PROT|nr:iron-sulfur cluster assembly scaffold protein [Acidisoma cellulosilyticum]MCB8880822.1 iron-sulfur cluster assembly scaffold protein [Acidisoma cellulosilyticum]
MTAASTIRASAEDIYQAVIMDRARRPRHQRLLVAAAVEAEARNPLCGDRVMVQLCFSEDGRVTSFGYRARACAICLAATDLMAEILPGLDETGIGQAASAFESALRTGERIPADSSIAALTPFAPLHDTPSRIQCALLGWQAVSAALAQRR